MLEFNLLFPVDASSRDSSIFNDLKGFIRINTGDQWAIFAMVLMEMLKNIFDHANASGGLNLKIEAGQVTYEVWDYGPGFVWDQSYNSSRLRGNGVNYGLGLKFIAELGKRFNCRQSISLTSGTRYKGSFQVEGL